jgi:dihydroxyacetone kinase
MKVVDDIVDDILGIILSDFGESLPSRVALLVNGLGATPPMELAIALRHSLYNLTQRGLKVERAWCGNFMTALEMPGFSLSLLPVDDERRAMLDGLVGAVGWVGNGLIRYPPAMAEGEALEPVQQVAAEDGPLSDRLRAAARAVATALERGEARLGDLDSKAGDGDLGASMVRGAAAIRELADVSYATPSRFLADLGTSVRRAIAGSSGPFYATGLVRAASHLQGLDEPEEVDWLRAFAAAIEAISELGGAKRGDRTMLDALYPALDAWANSASAQHAHPAAFTAAALAASGGAELTANMTPRVGRASYMGERALGFPDGGAVAVAIWMGAIDSALQPADCCH